MCIKKSVTEKSKHFFDFSTMIASNIELINGGEQYIRDESKLITLKRGVR